MDLPSAMIVPSLELRLPKLRCKGPGHGQKAPTLTPITFMDLSIAAFQLILYTPMR